MTPLTIKTEDLADFTGLPQSVIMSALEKAGVSAINTGKGRGRGLRWLSSAVIEVVATMHRDAQKKQQRRHVRTHSVSGRSVDDLYAELSGVLPQ